VEGLLPVDGKIFELRSADNTDREGISRLVRAILPEFGETYDEGGPESDLVNIERTYTEPGGTFAVLVGPERQIIGTAGLIPTGADCCKLRKMYIDHGYRNLGLGKFLLDYILKKAGELGFRKIMLETITSMEAAVAMYEKAGFTRIGRQSVSPRCDIVMEKEL
jgi:putative acetyltransferase